MQTFFLCVVYRKLPLLGQFKNLLSLKFKASKKVSGSKDRYTDMKQQKSNTREKQKRLCAVIPVRVSTDCTCSLHINLQITCCNIDTSKDMHIAIYTHSIYRHIVMCDVKVPCVQ